MDEKQFEQDYRNWKRQAAPDLWERIEGRLKDYPEREESAKKYPAEYPVQESIKYPMQEPAKAVVQEPIKHLVQEKTKATVQESTTHPLQEPKLHSDRIRINAKKRMYALAAGCAAVICLVVVIPGLFSKDSGLTGLKGSTSDSGSSDYVSGSIIAQETTAAEEFGETFDETFLAGDFQESISPEAVHDKAGQTEAGQPKAIPDNHSDGGVIQTKTRLTVPENALTLSSDTAYFSQAILQDTELLCTGTVKDASFVYDDSGRAVGVSYQLSLSQIHYAQDYIAQTDQITVNSPIVRAEGDEAWLLYQMEPGKTYLLPLKKTEGNWELLYPFAPQIQLTGERGYLFHSGYTSLINETTQVTAGVQEGENDYFYDRMLLREDEGFLSDFLELIP